MTKAEKAKINRYIDKAYEGVSEYERTLESICVITDWLRKIYELVNKADDKDSNTDKSLLYEILEEHAGHTVEIAEYGDGVNFALEDMDTGEVILDTDIYDLVGCC